MKTARNGLRLLWILLSGYVVAWTFGLVLGPLFMFLLATRRVRVVGYWNLVRTVLKGRVVVLTNHPTVFFETFGISGILFPWYLVFPTCFFFTMPDKRLLDLWRIPRWIRVLLRCIEVDRTSTEAGLEGKKNALATLRLRGVIVAHPEMGRTFGAANSGRTPLKRNGREMQEVGRSLLSVIAYDTGAVILPGWIDVRFSREAVSPIECVRRMFGRENAGYRPVIFSFRRAAHRVTKRGAIKEELRRIQDEIFTS